METDDAIAELVQAFEACTLPKARWTHHAHLTVALWYLRRLPREAATERMRANIQRYNRAVGGDPNGYHETITLAWIAVIAGFLMKNDRGQSQATLTAKLVRECGDKDYLLRYYTRERLMSEAARQEWVEGDVACVGGIGDSEPGPCNLLLE